MAAPGPSLALIEVASMARAYVILDALVKRAQVSVRWHREVTPGKTVILYGGAEEETLEAHGAALDASATALVDDLLLPQAHPQLWGGVEGHFSARRGTAAAILELSTVASTLLAADAALKATDVTLIKLRLAAGIGGRGFFILSGALEEVQAAAEAGVAIVRDDRLVAREVVSQPHDELWGFFSA